MATQHPLTAFSPYLAGRHQVLLAISAEIGEHLDAADRSRASDLLWLWILGAYEVARTLSQAHACLAPRFLREVTLLKVDLERVRVPSAKMERIKYDRRDRTVPVPSDRGPDVWRAADRDLLVGDPADLVSARSLLAAYARVMASLTAAEVLMRHEASFT